jgi:hypothetical protein
MQNRSKLEIKFSLKNLFLRDSWRKSGIGKMNGTAISQREIILEYTHLSNTNPNNKTLLIYFIII